MQTGAPPGSAPEREAHWESVYQTKRFDSVSWYAPQLSQSLRIIGQLCPDRRSAIVDVGAGESTLVDDLLALGYTDLSVLDISATAIEFTRRRLGARAALVHWHVGEITAHDFGPRKFDLWHDRAVFHFLTEPGARRAYVDRVRSALKPGGHLVMATFGPQGPLRCSGLDVLRYDAQALQRELGAHFRLLGSELTVHRTPMQTDQQFLYSWWRLGLA